jgi:hypothetical protein
MKSEDQAFEAWFELWLDKELAKFNLTKSTKLTKMGVIEVIKRSSYPNMKEAWLAAKKHT